MGTGDAVAAPADVIRDAMATLAMSPPDHDVDVGDELVRALNDAGYVVSWGADRVWTVTVVTIARDSGQRLVDTEDFADEDVARRFYAKVIKHMPYVEVVLSVRPDIDGVVVEQTVRP